MRAEGEIINVKQPRDLETIPRVAPLGVPTPGSISPPIDIQGVQVSAGGVRGVWSRHDLLSRHARLLRLDQSMREQEVAFSDEQVRMLERVSPEFRERHIEARHTGELVAVDTKREKPRKRQPRRQRNHHPGGDAGVR